MARQPDSQAPQWLDDPYLATDNRPGTQARASSRSRGRRGLFWALAIAVVAFVVVGAGVTYKYVASGALREYLEEKRDSAAAPTAVAKQEEPAGPADDEDDDLGQSTPAKTEERRVGKMTVVELGRGAASLRASLKDQQRIAKRGHQRMMMMITRENCEPCRGVDSALADELLQKQLQDVRLVRINHHSFQAELTEMHFPVFGFPEFFLLDANADPIDGIHGGEWDADIPTNIAPVLGAFVRGEYHKRRHQWAPSTNGVRL